MAWLRRKARKAPLSLRRSFVTPEGVDLRIELGSAGERAGAFVIDLLAILVVLIVATIAIAYLAWASHQGAFAVLWLLGFFVLRNGWFALFELSGSGSTPGKRLVGLRVVARDGARLTGGAVIARNAMREIELFLPLSFLGSQAVHGWADSALTLFALGWSGIFLFFPLFNRDRLRVGDLLAGTWVVHTVRGKLGSDLVVPVERERRVFSEAALGLYGVYELQMLEEVLRGGSKEAIVTVAATIRRKAGLPDDHDDLGFLTDYYAALCGRLERGLLVGRRRADKFA
ncbi:RDD family protein [Sphingomonas sp. AAP5]|uniref:RDD family protein n=1 Tax=Sphingomonas sp. AAP5 TaxID=1523415 RepID=UPI001057154D|nr:RDD family protein [Sphingomonas sp. AAP5]QBM76301.1 RDD family protein [Sphingomonas sp. AAP5]